MKRIMRKVSILLAAVWMITSVTACSMKEPGSTDTKEPEATPAQESDEGKTDAAQGESEGGASDKKLRVGFVVQDLSINYFLSVVKGVEDFQENYNMEVQVVDGHSDATAQVSAIENLVTQGVDCIVICPVDPVAPEAAVKEAQAKGIPVITWSEKIEGCDAWVAIDNYNYGYETGKIAGQWILDNLEKQEDAKVMYVYVQENEQLIQRGKGMEDGLASLAPNAETIAVQSGNTTESGMKAVETVLVKEPDMNVIVCSNDSVALGAYEAMAAAGKQDAKICITGLDADQKNLEYIAEGTILKGTVDLSAYHQGDLLCDAASQVIQNGAMEEPIYVKYAPVTETNVQEVLDQRKDLGLE